MADAVCVSVPGPGLGERLCACVVPATGVPAPLLPDLTTHLLAHGLARHKLPEQLLVENGTWAPPAGSAAALRPPAQFAA